MRPIRLELSAFGPYLERTVIDFEKLNEAGLFLITGQTGGGKTTLLDAMSIALFYKSTGGRRTFQDMRCLAPRTATAPRSSIILRSAKTNTASAARCTAAKSAAATILSPRKKTSVSAARQTAGRLPLRVRRAM